MKKVLLSISAVLLISVGAQANAVAKHFSPQKNGSTDYYGGVVGQNLIFVYKGMPAKDIKEDLGLSSLAKSAEKRVCGNKDSKKVVDNGTNVLFIYQEDDGSEATVVNIKSCKDYD